MEPIQTTVGSPVRILITGAAGNIGYSLAFMISQGRMFGPSIQVILHLFDLPQMEDSLKGVRMELTDGAFDLLKGVVITSDPAVGFRDIDYAVLCGAKPRLQGMERKDLLTANAKIFQEQGKYFDTYAKKTVKVLVVGNPANTNALILSKNSPSIPEENFTALTRLDHNRALAQLSEKLKIESRKIRNITIWGNHSNTQYPDADYAIVENHKAGSFVCNMPVKSLVADDNWVQEEFIRTVQQRGSAVIAARKLSSAASAANAICDHMRDWILGTSEVFFNFF
jgi:malate dehydrogenase